MLKSKNEIYKNENINSNNPCNLEYNVILDSTVKDLPPVINRSYDSNNQDNKCIIDFNNKGDCFTTYTYIDLNNTSNMLDHLSSDSIASNFED